MNSKYEVLDLDLISAAATNFEEKVEDEEIIEKETEDSHITKICYVCKEEKYLTEYYDRTENVDDPLRSNNMRRRAKEVKYFDFALRGNSSFVDETSLILESSIVQENNLKRLPRNNLFGLFGGRQGGENTLPKCTCDDPSPSAGTIGRACSTICRNSETLCSGSRTCYRSTTFMAI